VRILHVCDSYLPQLGGIELHVNDLAARQRADGADVHVATLTPAAGGPDATDVVRLPRLGRFPGPGAAGRMSRLVVGYDVVHAHVSLVSPLAWSAVEEAARVGVATTVTMHSMLPRGAGARALRPLLGNVPTGTVLTAVSTVAADALRGVLRDREVFVLPNGIEPGDWHPRAERAPGGVLTLVSTMRTARRKRPLPLLEILQDVRRRVPEQIGMRAVLVGAGPLDRAVRRRLDRSDLGSWVTQAGQLERTDIARLLARADVYLAPAKLESFGIAALEARCAGLPVVGMAQSGLRDFITDGTEGHLVDTDEQMAASTAELLTRPDQLHAMRSHNLRHRPSADWSVVVGLHREMYARASRLVASAGPASAHAAPATGREAAGSRPDQQAARS
jgi:glycosyltransferase involved in cell wall biosynthesis